MFSRVSQGYDWIERVTCEESAVPPGGICGPPPTRVPTQPPTRNVSFLSVLFGGEAFSSHGQLLTSYRFGYPRKPNLFPPHLIDSTLPSHSNSYDHTLTNIPLIFLIQPTNLPTRFPTRNVSSTSDFPMDIFFLNHFMAVY